MKILNIGIGDTDHGSEGAHKCRRCAGTGRFITYVENGVPKGPGGHCFRCGGKGFHTADDRKRNDFYDRQGWYRDNTGAARNVVSEMRRSSLNDLI